MINGIKSIPTTYAGVNFRSRLEARWAAFFDLCGWKWDYEPFDLGGWAPDFRLRTSVGPVLCEVKPADIVEFIQRQEKNGCSDPWPFNEYEKAMRHMRKHTVCLLGDEPLSTLGCYPIGIIDKIPDGAGFDFNDLLDALIPKVDATNAWLQAGNAVQWQPANDDYYSQMRRIFRKRPA